MDLNEIIMENLSNSEWEVDERFLGERKGRIITAILFFSLCVFFLSLMTYCSGKQGKAEEGSNPAGAVEEVILHVALWTSFPTLDWQSTVSHPKSAPYVVWRTPVSLRWHSPT